MAGKGDDGQGADARKSLRDPIMRTGQQLEKYADNYVSSMLVSLTFVVRAAKGDFSKYEIKFPRPSLERAPHVCLLEDEEEGVAAKGCFSSFALHEDGG